MFSYLFSSPFGSQTHRLMDRHWHPFLHTFSIGWKLIICTERSSCCLRIHRIVAIGISLQRNRRMNSLPFIALVFTASWPTHWYHRIRITFDIRKNGLNWESQLSEWHERKFSVNETFDSFTVYRSSSIDFTKFLINGIWPRPSPSYSFFVHVIRSLSVDNFV